MQRGTLRLLGRFYVALNSLAGREISKKDYQIKRVSSCALPVSSFRFSEIPRFFWGETSVLEVKRHGGDGFAESSTCTAIFFIFDARSNPKDSLDTFWFLYFGVLKCGSPMFLAEVLPWWNSSW